MKEEELEFISVTNEDDNDMNSSNFVDPYAPSTSNSAIGNWFFNQSKVPKIVCIVGVILLPNIVVSAPFCSLLSPILQISCSLAVRVRILGDRFIHLSLCSLHHSPCIRLLDCKECLWAASSRASLVVLRKRRWKQ